MSRPQRIQLKRTKGWKLQAASLALNGLPAVKVDRTTKWGNPFVVSKYNTPAKAVEQFKRAVADYADCELWLDFDPESPRVQKELGGKNLACWCPLDAPCHADVLLRMANPESGEA